MQSKLKFVATLIDGSTEEQEISYDPKEVEPARVINQILGQYATAGMLKKDGQKYTFFPAPQIFRVEVEEPTLVVADLTDIPKNNNIILG